MRKTLIASIALVSGWSVAATAWEFSYRTAHVKFAMFGGGLGDPLPPSANDTKIAFELRGDAARQMFDSIGPDKADACGGTTGERFRSRDDERLVCTRSARAQYTCYFGFDLKTGHSIGGSIC